MKHAGGLSIGQLRAFEAAVRLRSLSEAAKELRLTQPALTRSISKLEAHFGATLFNRNTAGTFPNEKGVILGQRVTRFFAQLVAALDLLSADKKAAVEKVLQLRTIHIRSLIAIWRLGSFRAAASDLKIADSTLHRPAREIEKIAGAKFYRRSANGVAVSPLGADVARRFAVALSEIESARDEIGLTITQRAAIRIGILPLTPRRFLTAAAEKALQGDPIRKIEVVEGAYSVLSRQIGDGELDVLFGVLAPTREADLVQEPLAEDPYVLVCRSEHPLTYKATPTADDLRAYGWIHPTRALPRRAVIDSLFRTWGLDARVQFETDSLPTTISMLLSTDRITILSQWHVSDRNGLVGIKITPVTPKPRKIGLTFRTNWLPTNFQRNFTSLLRAELNKWSFLDQRSQAIIF